MVSRVDKYYPTTYQIPRRKPVRPRGKRYRTEPYSISDYLIEVGNGDGDTTLEKEFAGAMKQVGIKWDARQWYVHLPWGSYTIIDFVIFSPLTAIYVDGWQHEARPEVAARDAVQRTQLRTLGWKVAEIGYKKIFADPYAAARSVLFAQ